MAKKRTVDLNKHHLRTSKAGTQLGKALVTGRGLGEALVELINLTYLDDNALEILHHSLREICKSGALLPDVQQILEDEFTSRATNWVREGNRIIFDRKEK